MIDLSGWFPITILGALAFGSGGFFIRLGSDKKGNGGTLVLLGLYLMGTLCFLGLSLLNNTFSMHPTLIIAGIVIGLGSVVGNTLWIRSFQFGPASLSGPLINTYNALVSLMAIVVFQEHLRVIEVVGIILILMSVSMIHYDPNESLAIRSKVWYVLILLTIFFFFLRTGGLKITEELNFDNTLVLGYGYAVGIVWFGIMHFRQQGVAPIVRWRVPLGSGLIAGVLSFLGMQLFAEAIAKGPASLVAPIFSTNGLIFALLTIVLLGERLSRYQKVSLAGTMTALILMRI